MSFRYTVALTFTDPSTAGEWLAWMRDEHAAHVVQAGAQSAEILKWTGFYTAARQDIHLLPVQNLIAMSEITPRDCGKKGFAIFQRHARFSTSAVAAKSSYALESFQFEHLFLDPYSSICRKLAEWIERKSFVGFERALQCGMCSWTITQVFQHLRQAQPTFRMAWIHCKQSSQCIPSSFPRAARNFCFAHCNRRDQ